MQSAVLAMTDSVRLSDRLVWPFVRHTLVSCENDSSTSWIRAFECQKIIRSVIASLSRYAQLTRCFSVVAELLVLALIGFISSTFSMHVAWGLSLHLTSLPLTPPSSLPCPSPLTQHGSQLSQLPMWSNSLSSATFLISSLSLAWSSSNTCTDSFNL